MNVVEANNQLPAMGVRGGLRRHQNNRQTSRFDKTSHCSTDNGPSGIGMARPGYGCMLGIIIEISSRIEPQGSSYNFSRKYEEYSNFGGVRFLLREARVEVCKVVVEGGL